MSFDKIQYAFMEHIRQPKENPLPHGIEDRRMAIYRDLFFNNIEGFISSGFPVLKSLYSREDWQKLIRKFFIEHDCQSPYFLDIAAEFVNYLVNTYERAKNDPIFMIELAHYEWVELDVSICQQDESELPIGSAITSVPLFLSSTARNLSYQFAVHNISADYIPTQPGATPHYFVVYRDHEDETQFLVTNAMTALLLSLIETTPGIDFFELCNCVLQQASQFSEQQIHDGANSTLMTMAHKGVVVTKNEDENLY
ncbi:MULTISPECIES: putative DNA-binding domain-containing protein [unclassified Pseudoalteromonas]|uniref:HvfC family RiPP maturation protein n=1 Tax=unclassified Pseudoalteromonas TaxID=194690 RepID=UPI000C07ADFF|nr:MULTISPECIES: putative DNA-binding domain-containing protein [unclassified Pseudoalteromonas]MDP2635910.1 putative DNA-binding domain-containing protein [Pseudoalteromonas sp. 1_MG-2023]PHN88510.1 DUF2063 domain-containing protein [Pseudoalteromonas sp. 3D05]